MDLNEAVGPNVSDDSSDEGIDVCDNELNRIVKMYEHAVQQEKYYILNTTLRCDCLFLVHCGLSSARNFEPAVKIEYKPNTDKNFEISFNTFEWPIFINHLSWLMDVFFIEAATVPDPKLTCAENIEISGGVYSGIKFAKVSNGHGNFYFRKQEVQELLKMNTIIDSKIEMLTNLKFLHFYYNVLTTVNYLIKQSNLTAVDVLNAFCNATPNSVHSYCLRECLYFNKDKVLIDLERTQ